MKGLNRKNIEIVMSAMKGKRLEHFLESLSLLEASLSAGGWVAGASRKIDKGFTGCGYQIEVPERPSWENKNKKLEALYEARNEVNYCLRRGYYEPSLEQIEMAIADMSEKEKKKTPPELIRAWCALFSEKRRAKEYLDSMRKLPKITAIGLSPRVTTTLKEMNLDLDINSIKYPEIAYRVTPIYTEDDKILVKGGKKNDYYEDKPQYCPIAYDPYVKWSKGIVHNTSRFAMGGRCHACGKPIPSRRFVPMEAKDKKSGKLVSMWLGCDCAKSIFGIVDEGMSQDAGDAK